MWPLLSLPSVFFSEIFSHIFFCSESGLLFRIISKKVRRGKGTLGVTLTLISTWHIREENIQIIFQTVIWFVLTSFCLIELIDRQRSAGYDLSLSEGVPWFLWGISWPPDMPISNAIQATQRTLPLRVGKCNGPQKIQVPILRKLIVSLLHDLLPTLCESH